MRRTRTARKMLAVGKVRGLTVAAAIALAVLAPSALAGGGVSIAAAPELPLSQQIVSGGTSDSSGNYREWWKVTLGASDKLVVDYGFTLPSPGCCGPGVVVQVYKPDVTDYTIGNSDPVIEQGTHTKNELVFVAPSAGRWLLLVRDMCCADGQQDIGYELTANVQTWTATAVTAPPLVASGKTERLRGQVKNATTGNVLVRLTGPKAVAPTQKVVSLTNGAFSWSKKLTVVGLYHVVVSYPGDSGHQPSSARATFHVG
jgi:hypothetical protein